MRRTIKYLPEFCLHLRTTIESSTMAAREPKNDFEVYLATKQGGAISNLDEDLDPGFAEFINELPPHLNRGLRRIVVFKEFQEPEAILMLSAKEIEMKSGLNATESHDLLIEISKFVFPQQATTVRQLLDSHDEVRRLSMGSKQIDDLFNGGLPLRGIIEVTGEAGAGKSQFCLQACLQTILPVEQGGLGAHALYISTEGRFPTTRWSQMVRGYVKKYPELDANHFHNHLYIEDRIDSIDALWDLLQQRIQDLMMRVELRLVIIDSVAALFRYEYKKEESLERAKSMFNHAHQLKFLSDHYKVGVIVVNQVSDYFYEHMGDSFSLNSLSNEKKVIPALGLSWSNCVNMRILLKKTNRMYRSEAVDMDNNMANDEEDNEEEGPKKKKRKITPTVTEAVLRTMTIILSSYLPNSAINFFVDSAGLKGIEESIH